MSDLLPRPVWQASPAAAERVWRAERLADRVAISVDGSPLGAWPEISQAARAVRGDVEIWAAAHAVGWVVVHAAVVVHRGVALVLPGPSKAGKTTMALALVRAGAQYCSDEFALLDDRGRVHPYPRRPSLRQPGPDRPPIRHLDLGELPGAVRRTPAPLGLIADLRYEAGGGPLEVGELAPPRAALALMANAVAARTQPETVLRAASSAAGGSRAVTGTRGDAGEAAPRLLAMMRALRSPA